MTLFELQWSYHERPAKQFREEVSRLQGGKKTLSTSCYKTQLKQTLKKYMEKRHWPQQVHKSSQPFTSKVYNMKYHADSSNLPPFKIKG